MSKQNTKHQQQNLKIAKGLRFRIAEDGNIYASISNSSGEFYIAHEVLSILAIISNTRKNLTIKEIPILLKTHFQQIIKNIPSDEECRTLINDLIGAGVLLAENDNLSKHMHNDGFGDPWAQWTMLTDKYRSESYYSALKKHVNSKSIVLDIGSGTGFLSAISLQLGAKKVIAIEETSSANSIKPILNKLNLLNEFNKFTLHNMNSFDVQLPHDITVVVSELFGNDAFQEGVLPTLREIGSRLFNKNITYIPKKITVFFDIVELHSHHALHRIKAFNSYQNKNYYDESFLSNFLFAAGKCLNLEDISFSLPLNKNDFEKVTTSTNLGTTNLNPPPIFPKDKLKHPFYGKRSIQISKDCLNALALIWFRVELTEGITISSLVTEKDACEHWSPIAIPLKKTLYKNDVITLHHYLNDDENYFHCHIFQNNEKIGSR